MNVKFRKFFSLEFYYAVLRQDLTKTNIWSYFFIKTLAILVVSIHRFIVDKNMVSASALTFYSILSLIPISALVLGIARGFGVDKLLENQLKDQTFTNPDIIDFVVHLANSALESVNGGIVAGVGIVFLIWSVLKVLGNTEVAMNKIWGIARGRNVKKKFTDYLSITFIAPILVILISGANVFLTTSLQDIAFQEGFLKYASSVIVTLLNFVPLILVWLLFIFIYMYMPTVQVKFKHALIGGIVAGTVFQIVQFFYIRFQVGVSSYNVIYGSLAAVPLLLIWLQLSWGIILWGTELTYVIRNRHFMYYNTNPASSWTEHVEKTILILKYIADEYTHDRGVPNLGMISRKFKISMGKLRALMNELTDKNILMEVKNEDEVSFIPVIDLHNLTVADVIIGLSNVDVEKSSDWERKYIHAIKDKFSGEYFVKEG